MGGCWQENGGVIVCRNVEGLLKGMWVRGHLKNEGLLIGAWMRVTGTWVSGCLQDMGKGYSQEHRIRS